MPRSMPLALGLSAARTKAGVIRGNDRIIQIVGEPATIDDRAQRLAIGKLVHQVAPPQLDRIEPASTGGCIDQPLDHVVHFRLAGAAIRIDRHGVGEDALARP